MLVKKPVIEVGIFAIQLTVTADKYLGRSRVAFPTNKLVLIFVVVGNGECSEKTIKEP